MPLWVLQMEHKTAAAEFLIKIPKSKTKTRPSGNALESETRPLKSGPETKTNFECKNARMNRTTKQHKNRSGGAKIHSFVKPENKTVKKLM